MAFYSTITHQLPEAFLVQILREANGVRIKPSPLRAQLDIAQCIPDAAIRCRPGVADNIVVSDECVVRAEPGSCPVDIIF